MIYLNLCLRDSFREHKSEQDKPGLENHDKALYLKLPLVSVLSKHKFTFYILGVSVLQ